MGNSRTEEIRTNNSCKISVDIIFETRKSICNINYKMNNEQINGTGFFMLVNDIKYLVTNYHVISETLINNNIKIKIWNKKEKFIQLNNRNYKCFEKLDITIIELKDTDEIINDIDFLDYDLNYVQGYKQYINKDIFTLQYAKDQIDVASGKITDILNNYEFKHNLDTDFGSSGSPIILHNALKVIGIHKSSDRMEAINFGSFIGEIFKYNDDNNCIIGEIYIKKEDIGKEIQIINSYNEYCKKKPLNKKNIKEEFKNEKEIKEIIIIEINNKKIPFSYIHKFEKEGVYQIKYKFNKSLTNSYMLFNNCSNLIKLDLSKFDGKNIINMYGMFCDCSSLTNLSLSNFNTQNAINMNNMFKNCKSLTYLDLSNFNTHNVKYMNGMFHNCSSLISLDLSVFNTENVIYMNEMFQSCSSLKNLNISKLITKNVVNMGNMFYGCSSLTNIDLSNFNTENVANMNGMFSNCSSLINLDLTNFNTQNVSSMLNMFSGCSSLANLDLSTFNTQNVYNMQKMFENCKAYITKSIKTKDSKILNGMNGIIKI